MNTTLQQSDAARFAPIAPDPPTPAAGSARESGGFLAAASPALWIGLAAVGLCGWSYLETDGRRTLGAIATLLAVAAVSWILGTTQTSKRDTRLAARRGVLLTVGVAALAAAAVVAGEVLSPFVLVLPVAVSGAALQTGRARQTDVAALLGLGGLAALGLRSIVWLDAPAGSTALFLGSAAFLTVFAYLMAGRMNLRGRPMAAPRVPSAASTLLTRTQVERLNEAESPIEVARVAADILLEAGRPTYLAIVEQIPDTDILRPLVERGSLDIDADRLRSGLAGLSHESIYKIEPRVIINDGTNLDSILCRRLGVDAIVIVPLRRMGAGLGAIHMAWDELESVEFVERGAELATSISHWITPDIAIARVANEIERGYVSAISAVCASLDEQSTFTLGHSRRVAKVALEIADLLPLSDHDQRQLLYVAEMHDVGRIGIGQDILEKPAALSDEEWTMVQTIPTRGAGIVEPVSYFGEVGEAIRHLRERWDGQGYPDRLEGEEIPLLARIVAIAEAYDAMTSERPYREAMSSTDALRQLWRERGHKFDPGLVEAFVMHRAPVGSARL